MAQKTTINSKKSCARAFKYIRQVHILEPWYNINRIEQIIGRAVRTCSHSKLDFNKRNVQIFLHTTKFDDESENKDVEALDLFVYRYYAQEKAKNIGILTRLLNDIGLALSLYIVFPLMSMSYLFCP